MALHRKNTSRRAGGPLTAFCPRACLLVLGLLAAAAGQDLSTSSRGKRPELTVAGAMDELKAFARDAAASVGGKVREDNIILADTAKASASQRDAASVGGKVREDIITAETAKASASQGDAASVGGKVREDNIITADTAKDKDNLLPRHDEAAYWDAASDEAKTFYAKDLDTADEAVTHNLQKSENTQNLQKSENTQKLQKSENTKKPEKFPLLSIPKNTKNPPIGARGPIALRDPLRTLGSAFLEDLYDSPCDPFAGITIEGVGGYAYGPFVRTAQNGDAFGPFFGEQDFATFAATKPVVEAYDGDRDEHCPGDCNGCFVKDWGGGTNVYDSTTGCIDAIDRCGCLADYGAWKLGAKDNEMYWCGGHGEGYTDADECRACDASWYENKEERARGAGLAAYGKDSEAASARNGVAVSQAFTLRGSPKDPGLSPEEGRQLQTTGEPKALTDDDGAHPIKAAVKAWLAQDCKTKTDCQVVQDYGPIGDWNTKDVTDMSYLFCGYHSAPGRCDTGWITFNEDIGDWDTRNVVTLSNMFHWASSFNQDISRWNTDKVADMSYMFYAADAFDQCLGWKISSGVPGATNEGQKVGSYLSHFSKAPCEVNWCGVNKDNCPPAPEPAPAPKPLNKALTDTTIKPAVKAWFVEKCKTDTDCPVVQEYGPIGDWNTKDVTDMSYLLCWHNNKCLHSAAQGFNEDISLWDTKKVTTMEWMFGFAAKFNADISGWKTEKVETMNRMFAGCGAFNADISGWKTTMVQDMGAMFYQASNFNADISGWETGRVEDMMYMFFRAYDFNQDIGSWDVRKVKNMQGMFYFALKFNQDISRRWITTMVTDMSYMFYGAKEFNQNIGGWDTKKVTTIADMFKNAKAFDQCLGWKLPPQTGANNAGTYSGSGCSQPQCGVNKDNCPPAPAPAPGPAPKPAPAPEPVTDLNIRNAVKLWVEDRALAKERYGNIKDWNTAGVTDMSFLFCVREDWMDSDEKWEKCVLGPEGENFVDDIGSWDTGKTASMAYMFHGSKSFDRSLDQWDTGLVKSMEGMFEGAISFDKPFGPDSKWKTDSVISMRGMFRNAPKFNRDINHWRTDNVVVLDGMFEGAKAYNKPLGRWKTDSLESMTKLLNGATAFTHGLGWCVPAGTALEQAFEGATCPTTNCGVSFKPNCGVVPAVPPVTDIKASQGKVVAILPQTSKDYELTFTMAVASTQVMGSWQNIIHIGNSDGILLPGIWFNHAGSLYVMHSAADGCCGWGIADSGSRFQAGGTYDIKLNVRDNTMTLYVDGRETNKATGSATHMSSDQRVYVSDPWSAAPSVTIRDLSYEPISLNKALTDITIKPAVKAWFDEKCKTDTDCPVVQEYGPIGDWNTKDVTDMSYLLCYHNDKCLHRKAQGFNEDISNWNTAKVTTMEWMFGYAWDFNQDISGWNTEKVEDMSYMFAVAIKFNQDIGRWKTTMVKNMQAMFSSAHKFNQDIGDWDTQNVVTFKEMFSSDQGEFDQDISRWKTEKVLDMSWMFGGAKKFNNGGRPLNWATQNVADMSGMFYNAKAFDQCLSGWDTSGATLNSAFTGAGCQDWDCGVNGATCP